MISFVHFVASVYKGGKVIQTIDNIKNNRNVFLENENFIEVTLLGQNVNSYRTPDGEFPKH